MCTLAQLFRVNPTGPAHYKSFALCLKISGLLLSHRGQLSYSSSCSRSEGICSVQWSVQVSHLDTELSEVLLLGNANQLQPHSPTLLSLKLASDI